MISSLPLGLMSASSVIRRRRDELGEKRLNILVERLLSLQESDQQAIRAVLEKFVDDEDMTATELDNVVRIR